MASSAVRRTIASTFPSLSRRLHPSLSRRLHPSLSHILPIFVDDDPHTCPPHRSHSRSPPFPPSQLLPLAWHRERRSVSPLSHLRCYSLSSVGGGGDEIENLNVSADAFVDGYGVEGTAAGSAKVLGEVAAAAADSNFLIASLQHLIDDVHYFTGLNWWAAIALTTLFVRISTVPLLLDQMRAPSKLSALKPELDELEGKLENTKDPQMIRENRRKIKELFKKHDVSPLSPVKGIFIQGPILICFYFAISNMVEKVPSFREGGVLWFTDLTTPDPFYVFPILTGLTLLGTIELSMQEVMKGNPISGSMKKFYRLLVFLTVPFTASFPKAVLCYWITSNFFSLVYGAVLKHYAPVRKFFNLPDVRGPSVATHPSFPFLSRQKKQVSAASSSTLVSPNPKLEPPRLRVYSSFMQRIQALEKAAEGKKSKHERRSR